MASLRSFAPLARQGNPVGLLHRNSVRGGRYLTIQDKQNAWRKTVGAMQPSVGSINLRRLSSELPKSPEKQQESVKATTATFMDRAVDMINDRITKHPREALAGILCMEIISIYGVHKMMVLSGVQIPAEYALAFAMGRPLRRLRFPVEIIGAGALSRLVPALKRVKITEAVSEAVPASFREKWSSSSNNSTLRSSGEALGKVIDKYGAAYFISARYLGVAVVWAFYAAILQGFDVTGFLAQYGIQNFGSVIGTWAAAVNTSAILYPCTIAAGAALSPSIAHITRMFRK